MTCKTHPDAPHGFDRNASHSQDRYVCECESWEPPEQTKPMGVSCPRCGKTGLQPDSIHTCTPLALVLADALDNPTIQAGAIRHEIAAELRRLHELYEQARDKAVRMIEANDQWAAKTQWVQDTVQQEELGMHRADVLKQRIDRLVNTLAETHATYQAKLLHDEALLRQALDALDWIVTGRGHDTIETAHAAIRTRLGEAT